MQINETERLRYYKTKLRFSTADLARVLNIDEYVIRAILRGKTDRLRKNEEGSYLPSRAFFRLLNIDIDLGEGRPIRRDGRPLAKWWKKTPGGSIPNYDLASY